MEEATVALAARGIEKSFGATRALRGVDLTLRRGEIHALLGGNGAGKSTLIKILSGELAQDAGDVSGQSSSERDEVSVVHQELSIMRDLSIGENLFLGSAKGLGVYPWRKTAARTSHVLEALGLDSNAVQPSHRAASLPLHQLQLVEIGRALAREARVVLLDEPTAALTAQETETLFNVLRRLRAQGTSFIFVSHRMDEIRRIADRMTIIRDGVTVVDAAPVQSVDDTAVLREMFGPSFEHNPNASTPATRRVRSQATVVATLQHPDLKDKVTIHAGDVIGLAGAPLGPQLLLDALLGDRRAAAWDIDLGDGRGAPNNTRDAILRGVGYLSGDRGAKGLFPELSIYDNASVAEQVVGRRWLNRPSARSRIDRQATRMGFAHQDLRAAPESLSGGTQQKVLLARWLDLPVRLLLLEEPTRGVDLHTKRDLYRIVEELAGRGCAVIWWSSEYAELKETCRQTLAFDVVGNPVALLAMEDTAEHDLLLATGTA